MAYETVTDFDEIDAILNNLDTPMAVGGNTFDGLIVDAEEMTAWRALRAAADTSGEPK